MTEEAKRIMKEEMDKFEKEIDEKAKGLSIQDACHNFLESMAIFSAVIKNNMDNNINPYLAIGGGALVSKFSKLSEEIMAYRLMYEMEKLRSEVKKGE